MAYQFPPDVVQLIKERLDSGDYDSEDDVLRHALRALGEEEQDLAAVKQAVDELNAGDEGIALDEAFDSIREKYQIPSDT